eukprot:GCRY01003267.1.p1 GENE.GCRY01003267.1~~GCRY01003267.1.p1  ORF type:complete len:3020 (-),score=82.64 GCRY01003267.1:164-9223(-)
MEDWMHLKHQVIHISEAIPISHQAVVFCQRLSLFPNDCFFYFEKEEAYSFISFMSYLLTKVDDPSFHLLFLRIFIHHFSSLPDDSPIASSTAQLLTYSCGILTQKDFSFVHLLSHLTAHHYDSNLVAQFLSLSLLKCLSRKGYVKEIPTCSHSLDIIMSRVKHNLSRKWKLHLIVLLFKLMQAYGFNIEIFHCLLHLCPSVHLSKVWAFPQGMTIENFCLMNKQSSSFFASYYYTHFLASFEHLAKYVKFFRSPEMLVKISDVLFCVKGFPTFSHFEELAQLFLELLNQEFSNVSFKILCGKILANLFEIPVETVFDTEESICFLLFLIRNLVLEVKDFFVEQDIASRKLALVYFRTLIVGLRGLCWKLRTVGRGPFESGLISTFSELLLVGMDAISSFCSFNSYFVEEKILEQFAGIFSLLHNDIFSLVISKHLDFLVQKAVQNEIFVFFPQYFLSNPNVSHCFVELFFTYLLNHLERLGSFEARVSTIHLRFFKLIFGSVNLFQENEVVLQTHLCQLINSSLKQAIDLGSERNGAYFLMFRSLFRSIGGGKFELLYNEFLPLLSFLLESLNKLQDGDHSFKMKHLFIELSLTVPVRLSSLLPFIHMLMKPLVLALSSSSEILVTQGLRTLELCVDNLRGDFLEPVFESYRAELLHALFIHLKASPYKHGVHAGRILGKFGGHVCINHIPQFFSFAEKTFPISFFQHEEHVWSSWSLRLLKQFSVSFPEQMNSSNHLIYSSFYPMFPLFYDLLAYRTAVGATMFSFEQQMTLIFEYCCFVVENRSDFCYEVLLVVTLSLPFFGCCEFADILDYVQNKLFCISWKKKYCACLLLHFCLHYCHHSLFDGHEKNLIESLMFVVKNCSQEISVSLIELSIHLIHLILKQSDESCCQQLLSILAKDISHSSSLVRKAVLSSFDLVSTCFPLTLHELLKPNIVLILRRIFENPPQSSSVATQIGIIDALIYLLNVRPLLVPFSPQLFSLLGHVLKIAETEETQYSSHINYKNRASITKLRMLCLEVLSCFLLSVSKTHNDVPSKLKDRLIEVFFKLVTSSSSEIAGVAFEGLKQFVHVSILRKDVLQNSLRPALSHLSDFSQLSIPILLGLKRLVEVLSNCFNKTLGDKLFEHLLCCFKHLKERTFSSKQSDLLKMIGLLIDILYLLSYFDADSVSKIIKINIAICSFCRETQPVEDLVSPFFSRFPEQVSSFFFDHLEEKDMLSLFCEILDLPSQTYLREVIHAQLFAHLDFPSVPLAVVSLVLLDNKIAFTFSDPFKSFLFRTFSSLQQSSNQIWYKYSVDSLFSRLMYWSISSDENNILFFLELLQINERIHWDSFAINIVAEKMDESGFQHFISFLLNNVTKLSDSSFVICRYIVERCAKQSFFSSLSLSTLKQFLSLVSVMQRTKLNCSALFVSLVGELCSNFSDASLVPMKKDLMNLGWTCGSSTDKMVQVNGFILLSKLFEQKVDLPFKMVAHLFCSLLKSAYFDLETFVFACFKMILPRLSDPHAKTPDYISWLLNVYKEELSSQHLFWITKIVVHFISYFFSNLDKCYDKFLFLFSDGLCNEKNAGFFQELNLIILSELLFNNQFSLSSRFCGPFFSSFLIGKQLAKQSSSHFSLTVLDLLFSQAIQFTLPSFFRRIFSDMKAPTIELFGAFEILMKQSKSVFLASIIPLLDHLCFKSCHFSLPILWKYQICKLTLFGQCSYFSVVEKSLKVKNVNEFGTNFHVDDIFGESSIQYILSSPTSLISLQNCSVSVLKRLVELFLSSHSNLDISNEHYYKFLKIVFSRLSLSDSWRLSFLNFVFQEIKVGRISIKVFEKYFWDSFCRLIDLQAVGIFLWFLERHFNKLNQDVGIPFSITFVSKYKHLWSFASLCFFQQKMYHLTSNFSSISPLALFSIFWNDKDSFCELFSQMFSALDGTIDRSVVITFLNYCCALPDSWAPSILNCFTQILFVNSTFAIPPHLLSTIIWKTKNYFGGFALLEKSLLENATLSWTDFFSFLSYFSFLQLTDYVCGLTNIFFGGKCAHASLTFAIGLWEDAAESIIRLLQADDFTSKIEFFLWEQHFFGCLENLMFYDLMGHHYGETGDQIGLCNSFWNLFRWSFDSCPNDILLNHKTVEQLVYLKNFTNVKASIIQSTNEVLQIWEFPLSSSLISLPHLALLPRFQLLVEVEESTILLQSIISNSYKRPQITHDLRALFSTWRERLPNLWESSSCWTMILSLRFRVFELINHICRLVFDSNDPNSFVGYHEMAWTINQLATSVRQNGFPGIALNILNNIHDLPNIEVQDAFVKLKEQAMCYGDIKGAALFGLDNINKTNLDYYPTSQKSEFFAIKGWFLSQAGYCNEANDSFVSGIKLSDSCTFCWKLWGDFCFSQGKSKNIVLLHNAFNCYLHALKQPSQRNLIVQILYMMSSFVDVEFAKLLEFHFEHLPQWIWLFWLKDLLFLLTFETYKSSIAAILHRLSLYVPQSIFIFVRAFLHQEKQPFIPNRNNDYHYLLEMLLSRLHQNHPSTLNSLDKVLHDISGQNFIVEPERFLLSYIQVILTRCHTHNHPEEYSTVLQPMLSAIRKELFSEKFMVFPKFSERRQVFQRKFHKRFLEDFFCPAKPVLEIVDKLLWWKTLLRNTIDTFPLHWLLKDTSAVLPEVTNSRIFVPGVFFSDSEPYLEHSPKILSFHHRIDIISANSATTSDPSLKILSSTGKLYSFLVRHHRGGQYGNSNDVRMMHLSLFLNKLLLTFNETRRRGIELPVSSLIPINSDVSLQAYFPSISLEDVLSNGLQKMNRSVDSVVLQFKNSVNRLVSYIDIVNTLQTGNYLQEYLFQKFHFSPLGYFGYRTFFSQSVGVMALITSLFSVHERTPRNMQLTFQSGSLLHHGLRIGYDRFGSIESNEPPVPFRLTPSFLKFMSPVGVEGVFSCAFSATLVALEAQKNILIDYLSVFMREDLSSFQDPHSSARFLPDLQNLPYVVESNKRHVENSINQFMEQHSNGKTLNVTFLRDLITKASSPFYLSLMIPSYHSWF